MKKKVSLLTGLLLLGGYAIPQARDGTAMFQKKLSQPAAIISLPYTPKITKAAFQDYLSKTSNKDQEKAKTYLLSANTKIAKANTSDADMHFFIGQGDSQNKNGSVIYLKLNSFSRYENNLRSLPIQFDMEKAIDYLDNLAIAIKPYATELQKKWQQKVQANSQKTFNLLVEECKRLDMKKTTIQLKIDQNKNAKRADGLRKDMVEVEKKISENVTSRTKLEYNIAQQAIALASLQ